MNVLFVKHFEIIDLEQRVSNKSYFERKLRKLHKFSQMLF